MDIDRDKSRGQIARGLPAPNCLGSEAGRIGVSCVYLAGAAQGLKPGEFFCMRARLQRLPRTDDEKCEARTTVLFFEELGNRQPIR